MSSTTTQHVSTKKNLVKDLVKDLLGSWDCDSATDRLRVPTVHSTSTRNLDYARLPIELLAILHQHLGFVHHCAAMARFPPSLLRLQEAKWAMIFSVK